MLRLGQASMPSHMQRVALFGACTGIHIGREVLLIIQGFAKLVVDLRQGDCQMGWGWPPWPLGCSRWL